jgi:hypothetical protein
MIGRTSCSFMAPMRVIVLLRQSSKAGHCPSLTGAHRDCLVPAALLQVLCSISIIAITSNRITHPGFGTQKRCYLSSDPDNTSPCSLAYAAAGVSLATAVLAACLKVGFMTALSSLPQSQSVAS